MAKLTNSSDKVQSDKFKETARELECDENEARWDERLRKVAKQKPPERRPGEDHSSE